MALCLLMNLSRNVRACWLPAVDVLETGDACHHLGRIARVGRENISIELSGRQLVISGRHVENAEIDYAAYHTIERVEGYFERSFNIPGPVDVEQAKARYVDGILDLYLPKSEEEPDRCFKIECKD